MPVENSMNIGIRPASPAQKAGATEGVQRRGDGSGASQAFSPKTNVSIQNAVNDMAGILAKISSNQSESVEAMPETIQKLVQNVMKEAFSLEETLAQGLGSTLESQRFSLDQLTSLSRMLSQLGTLAEKNMPAGASAEMQTLLTNLKASVNAEGAGLEPVLLTKVAFELLDGKSASELPQQLQQLLAALQPQGQTTSYPTESSSSLGFLKQLVEYMMPRPATTTASAQQGNAPASNAAQPGSVVQTGNAMQPGDAASATQQGSATVQTAQAGQNLANAGGQTVANGQTGAQAGTNAMPTGSAQVAQAGGQQTAPGQMGTQAANGQTVATSGANAASIASGASQSPVAANATSQFSGTAVGQQATGQAATTPTAGATATAQTGGQVVAQGSGQSTVAASGQQVAGHSVATSQSQGGPASATQVTAQLGSAQTARQTKQELMNQTIENTPAAMEAMRGAAAQLLQAGGTSISEGDALLLQSFINGKEQLLNAKETRELQQLVRLCQQNIPATVQQAAQQQNLPDLPRLWAFMQLCDMAGADTRRMNARTLKKAGKDIASFVIGMRASLTGDNTTAVQGQRSLNFMMSMYMDDVTYPAYIHVYDEEKQDELTGELKKETWLRLCVLTDNIGAVELTCRVYGEQLDMRVVFSDSDAAKDFRENADELKAELKDSRLKLNDFKIGAPGNAESI